MTLAEVRPFFLFALEISSYNNSIHIKLGCSTSGQVGSPFGADGSDNPVSTWTAFFPR